MLCGDRFNARKSQVSRSLSLRGLLAKVDETARLNSDEGHNVL